MLFRVRRTMQGNLNCCPSMNLHNHWGERCTTSVEASTTTVILPTDIMLGRGPTCYNNPGNRVFRKLVKEHVELYKNEARRREKSALVKMLISKLSTKGYRFLHRSATGTWVEAPTHIVEKKVGHGLRDARLSASKVGSDIKVLPKNFRPAIAEPKHTVQAEAVVSEAARATRPASPKAMAPTPS